MRLPFSAQPWPLAAVLAFALLAPAARAQAPLPPQHDPQTSMLPDAKGAVAWSLLASTAIRKVDGRLGPDFPGALKPLNGKAVKLQGYILPLEAGQVHRHFLLSAWSPGCPFCLTAGPEAMVEVKAKSAVKYSPEPVVVQGSWNSWTTILPACSTGWWMPNPAP